MLIQFEDFQTTHAGTLLERYRKHHLVFNDDIQGTATTVLGGVYGALAAQGKPPSELVDQRFVVAGAGSAGMGVVDQLAKAMVKHGLSAHEARARFWVLDVEGLVSKDRHFMPEFVKPFARQEEGVEGMQLEEAIRKYKPTVLIGLSAVGGLFREEHLRAMTEGCEKPVVLPLSNPTSKLECMASQCAEWTEGRAIYAAGSPQPDVAYGGRTIASSQSNNMYIFPGLALGAAIGKTQIISDHMLMTASEALVRCVDEEELAQGRIFPRLSKIRDISLEIACSVIQTAAEDGHCSNRSAEILECQGMDGLKAYVKSKMFKPCYSPLVYLPPGVGE